MVWCPVLVRVMNGWMRAVWECVENIILERLRKNGSKEHHTGKEMRPVQSVGLFPAVPKPPVLTLVTVLYLSLPGLPFCLPAVEQAPLRPHTARILQPSSITFLPFISCPSILHPYPLAFLPPPFPNLPQ